MELLSMSIPEPSCDSYQSRQLHSHNTHVHGMVWDDHDDRGLFISSHRSAMSDEPMENFDLGATFTMASLHDFKQNMLCETTDCALDIMESCDRIDPTADYTKTRL